MCLFLPSQLSKEKPKYSNVVSKFEAVYKWFIDGLIYQVDSDCEANGETNGTKYEKLLIDC